MEKFEVVVTRTSFATATIEVEAENENQAKEKALAAAGNHEFSEHAADYEVEFVSQKEKE